VAKAPLLTGSIKGHSAFHRKLKMPGASMKKQRCRRSCGGRRKQRVLGPAAGLGTCDASAHASARKAACRSASPLLLVAAWEAWTRHAAQCPRLRGQPTGCAVNPPHRVVVCQDAQRGHGHACAGGRGAQRQGCRRGRTTLLAGRVPPGRQHAGLGGCRVPMRRPRAARTIGYGAVLGCPHRWAESWPSSSRACPSATPTLGTAPRAGADVGGMGRPKAIRPFAPDPARSAAMRQGRPGLTHFSWPLRMAFTHVSRLNTCAAARGHGTDAPAPDQPGLTAGRRCSLLPQPQLLCTPGSAGTACTRPPGRRRSACA
jgi:hypothetical protein